MFDWLKFLPIQLRFNTEVDEVRGPYFSKFHSQTFGMNDCQLYFGAPRQSYAWRRRYGLDGGGTSINSNEFFSQRLQPYNGFRPTGRWGHNLFLQRSWMLSGPWFTGPEAHVHFSGEYVGPYSGSKDRNSDFEGSSFFHPSVFENALADYLTSRFGQSDDGSNKKYRAPVEWRRVQIAPQLQAAHFKLEHPDICNTERFIVFPIADNRFVLLTFRYSGNVSGPFLSQLDDLTQRIIETIHLELSPQIIAKLDELKASGVDTNLSEHFAPLNWHTDEEPDGEPLQRIGGD